MPEEGGACSETVFAEHDSCTYVLLVARTASTRLAQDQVTQNLSMDMRKSHEEFTLV